jgi:hypothetical protein
MRHGKQNKDNKKALNMSGRSVVVTYTRKNGNIYVSNGWVI